VTNPSGLSGLLFALAAASLYGVNIVSTRFAALAGISSGLVYQYVREKDDVLLLVILDVVEAYAREIPTALEGLDDFVDLARALAPVDAPVVRGAAAEIAAARQVLLVRRRHAVEHGGERAVEQELRGGGDLTEHVDGAVVGQDGNRELVDDAPGVGLLDHLVQGGARGVLAAQDGPVHRGAAAELGQQRAVHVVGAAHGGGEERGLQHEAVVEREDEIRRDRLHAGEEFRRVRVVGRGDFDVIAAGQLLDALEPDVLLRVVAVRHDERHVHAMGEQHREAAHAHVVVRKDDRRVLAAHSVFSRTAWTR